MLFQAMIGPPPHPYWWENGFFFQDREVRDLVGVQTFQSVSAAQGYPGVLQPVVVKATSDPLYVPRWPVPLGFGGPELIQTLNNWLARPPLTAAQVPLYRTTMTWATISIAWLQILQPFEVAWVQNVIASFEAEVAAQNLAQAD